MGRNVLAVIPARGGSKGIPRKNIRLMDGQPLISYVIQKALKSKYINKVIVSTDDEEIAEVSRRYGAEVFIRPKELADDKTPLDPVIYNVIETLEMQEGYSPDIVATIQPTSPLLTSKTMDTAIEMLLTQDIDTVISAVDDRHLSWTIKEETYIPKYEKRLNRQYLPKEFRETGGILVTNRKCITDSTRIGKKVQLIETPLHESIDIDTEMDWWVAEKLLNRRRIVIRVDGYKEIGLGHIYRTLTLASRIIEHEVIFLMDEKHSLGIEVVQKNNYKVQTFSGDVFEAIDSLNPDIIINDILNTDYSYIQKIKDKNIFIVNFEDLGKGSKAAHVVFNALYDDGLPYSNHYYGKDYYCLREEFYSVPEKTIFPEVKNILITFGGTDPCNLSEKVVRALEKVEGDYNIDVVLGLGYKLYDDFVEQTKRIDKKINIYQNVKSMSTFMHKADIIFSSAGRTMYEIASIGTPAIILAQNDRELTHLFGHSDNGFINLGLGNSVSEQKIVEVTTELMQNEELRNSIHKKMKANDLKNGANKVLDIIYTKYKEFEENLYGKNHNR